VTARAAPRTTRNGQPEFVPYVRKARPHPWADAVLAAATAEHGEPAPTCFCGQPMAWKDGRAVRCPHCGRTVTDYDGGS
jgi:hypothetical protein